MLSLRFADVEAKVASCGVDADFCIFLQLLIILLPDNSWGWFATVATRQHTAVSNFHHHSVPEVQFQRGWF